MSLLSGLFRGGDKAADPATEAELDALGKKIWDPFPRDWSLSRRQSALPEFIAEQEALAQDLLEQFDLTQPDERALDTAWEHLLATRKLVKTGRGVSRRRAGRDRRRYELTHREDFPSLVLLRKIAALFGIVLQRTLPGVEWVIGHDPDGGYVHEGQPILRGFPGDFPEMNPGQVILNLSGQSIGRPAKPLSQIVHQWARGVTVPGLDHDDPE